VPGAGRALRRVEERADQGVEQLWPLIEGGVAGIGQDQQLPARQRAVDLGCLLNRREVVVPGNHEHRHRDRPQFRRLEHHGREPQRLGLRDDGQPVPRAVRRDLGVVRAKGGRHAVRQLLRRELSALLGLLWRQARAQVGPRDEEAPDEPWVVAREQQPHVGAVAVADDVDRANAKRLDRGGRVLCHLAAREWCVGVRTVAVAALVDADDAAKCGEVVALCGDAVGEVVEAAMQEEQLRPAVLACAPQPFRVARIDALGHGWCRRLYSATGAA
jgi:hypothetical protein